jgi:hypothetical protein
MADRYDRERRRREWENAQGPQRQRRGPQGFTRDDWSQARRYHRPVQNPLEDYDDYSMRHREGWEGEDNWGRRPERDFRYTGEDRPQRGRHSQWEQHRQQEESGYGDIQGRGYGWEGGHMDPYNRGFFRREEAAEPDYMDRYEETHFGDEWDTGEDMEGEISYSYTEFWLMPGPFSGVGPKGYQRNDQDIFEDVCYRMSVNGQLDPSEIEIKVEDGEVTLEGKVGDRHSKRLAEDIADSVSGVFDVHNRLRVEGRSRQGWVQSPEGEQTQTDTGEQT